MLKVFTQIVRLSTSREGRLDTCLNGESPSDSNSDSEELTELKTELKKDNPVPNRIYPRKQPGLYIILCKANNWRYYGQSGNLSQRLASHKALLTKKIHSNKLLQQDFLRYGIDQFVFSVLCIDNVIYMGPSWEDPDTRLSKEEEFIKLHRAITYNVHESSNDHEGEKNPFYNRRHTEISRKLIGDSMRGIPNDKLGRKVFYKGTIYNSIAECSRQTGHSRKYIRQHFVEKQELPPNQPQTNAKRVVQVDGVTYASIVETAKRFHIGRPTVIARINNKLWPTWKFVNPPPLSEDSTSTT